MSGIMVHCFLCLAIISQVVLINVSALLPGIDDESDNSSYTSNDPDISLPTPYMIKRAGYPVEVHIVTTEDGYMLTMHRIRGCRGSQPVLLQHGLLGSSADWVMMGKERGLAYLLADRGYDVWLGNARGNTYSKAHVTLSTNDAKYWNFTWHEMGIYDLPAMITYIAKENDNKLMYVGHSMGTTMYYVMDILRPNFAKLVSAMFSLAPEAYCGRMKSPIRYVTPFTNDIAFVARFLGQNELLPNSDLIKFFSRYGCDEKVMGGEVCANILFVIAGYDHEQLDRERLPVILSHTPAGASTKTLAHYGQLIESWKFRQYDYGPMKNKEVYNSSKPPDYDLKKLSTPIDLYYADNDWLANVKDVALLEKQIRNKLGSYRVPFPKFNHLDFLYAKDVDKYVYNDLVKRMEKLRIPPVKCESVQSQNDV